ncbi:hypothetical protein N9L89_00375 [Gammaproteobacteria bacterium]|nr:hypothetical protein [Gammaproteobacteria bacterium]
MENSDLLILIGVIVFTAYTIQYSIISKIDRFKDETESLLKAVDVEIKTLEQALIRRINDKLDVLTKKFDDVDMDFISDVLQDVDSELLNEREAQIWRLGERERETARKKEAEERKNEFIKKKNALEIKKN